MRIDSILFLVCDMETACPFFCQVLGCKEIWRTDEPGSLLRRLYKLPDQKMTLVKLSLGKEFIYLMHVNALHIKPYPLNVRGHDLIFQHMAIVVSNMEKAHSKLMQHGIEGISVHPQTIPEWNRAAAGIQAFYFRSPSRYPFELIYFPPGKGDPRWQEKTTQLFLGIDHTAITVADTETSRKFYCDLFHFVPIGESLNYGETQEKLSGVPGAKVQITSLHSPNKEGIGLEFLHYLNLKSTHPPFSQLLPHEQARIHLIVEIDDLADQKKKLHEMKIPILSEGEMHLDGQMRASCVISDPDGHRLLLVESKFSP